MRLRHVYTGLLNTTTVIVLQVFFVMKLYIYEMSPPMLEQHVKESKSRGVTLTLGLASALV